MGEYLYVMQKQPNGKYKQVAVAKNKLTTQQQNAAGRNGLNGGAKPAPIKTPMPTKKPEISIGMPKPKPLPTLNKPNVSQGVYPGSGVATGGTQGRPTNVSQGISSVGGGLTRPGPGASQPSINPNHRPANGGFTAQVIAHQNATRPTVSAPPVKKASADSGFGNYLYVMQKQANGTWKRVAVNKNKLTKKQRFAAMANGMNDKKKPAQKAPTAGQKPKVISDPAPGASGDPQVISDPAPQEPVDPFAKYRDPEYWDDYISLKRGYDDQNNEHVSRLAGLNSLYGGKTYYDRLREQVRSGSQRQGRMTRDEAAKLGVSRSGWMDRSMLDLSTNTLDLEEQAIREYGTDVNDSRSAAFATIQDQNRIRQQFEEQQRLLTQAAAARNVDTDLSRYANIYDPRLSG